MSVLAIETHQTHGSAGQGSAVISLASPVGSSGLEANRTTLFVGARLLTMRGLEYTEATN
jgi:hypothetical protein